MKKVFAIVLSVLMVLSLFAGCGAAPNVNLGGNTGGEGSGNTVIKVGTSGPLTGDYAVYGVAVANGLELAFEEINAKGGLQFAVKAEDDEADPEKAVNAYNSLMDWGMQIMMGTVTSAPCIAVEAEASNDNMFLITPSGTAVDCIQYDNAFRLCFSDPNQGAASAKYIGENALAEKVAVIYKNDDAYSKGIYQKFMSM